MLDADFVKRSFRGTTLPFYQEIREKHPDAIARVTLDYTVVVNGTHSEKMMSVSHRWMQPDEPDPDGEQFKAIKSFLNSPAGKKIELIWLDSACMPQDHPKGSRTAEDKDDFKRMVALRGEHALPGHHRPHPPRPILRVALLDAVRVVACHAVRDAKRPQAGRRNEE